MPPPASSHTKPTKLEDTGLQDRRISKNPDKRTASLSPAQLARKREYDREAQRMSRKKTTDRIKALEITLEAQQEQGSQLLHKNEALEAKIVELQSQLSGQGPMPRATSVKPEDIGDNEAPITGPYPYGPPGVSWEPPSQVSSIGLDPGPTTISRPLLSSDSSSIPPFWYDPNTNEDPYDYAHASPPSRTQVMRNVDTSGSHPTQSSTLATTHSNRTVHDLTPDFVSSCWQAQPSVYAWQISTKLSPPTTPTDQMVLSVVHAQRHLARTNNISGKELIGPKTPSVNALFGWTPPQYMHPLPLTLTTALSHLETIISSVPNRVASFLATYRLYQWQIDPSASTYANLFEWQAPRPSQLLTPHPAWMDHPPWGKFRDKIVQNQALYGTLEFQLDFFKHTCVSWPYQLLDAVCMEDGQLRVSPLMETHLGKVENMTMDRAFLQKYPEFRDLCRFEDE